MSWVRFGRFWGYGDIDPQLIILADSIVTLSGPNGYIDATTTIQEIASKTICRTLVLSYPEASVLRGDYKEMAEVTSMLGAALSLVSS